MRNVGEAQLSDGTKNEITLAFVTWLQYGQYSVEVEFKAMNLQQKSGAIWGQTWLSHANLNMS